MTKTYGTGIWDDMHYYFEGYNDHMMHASMHFDGHIDEVVLTKAYSQLTAVLPILKSVFKFTDKQSYWQEMDKYNPADWIQIKNSENFEEEVDAFLCKKIEQGAEAQMKILIVRGKDKDAMGIILNHQVMDGACFKKAVNMLADTYTKLLSDPNYKLVFVDKDRSFKQIYKDMDLATKLKVWTMFQQSSSVKGKTGFPFETMDKSKMSPYINKYRLSSDKFLQIKAYGKANGYSINDMLMACYIMSLFDILNMPKDENLELDMIIDLRRYIKDPDSLGFSNYVSTTRCTQNKMECPTLKETLMQFKEKNTVTMSNMPGHSGVSRLFLGFGLFGFKKAHKVVLSNFNNPLIATSNIGIVKFNNFGALKFEDCYMTGSIKIPPYMQLALTTFNNAITFTMAQWSTDADRKFIAKFFEIFGGYLNEMADMK
ncbi:MAG: condensation domain-containing protein [Bacillota bacterium]